jgi:hypothetical protein
MLIRSTVLVLTLALVAACGSTTTNAQGTGTGTAQLPDAGELYLVTYLDDAGPSFGVRVEAVGPNGRPRPVATIADVRPAGWDEAAPVYDFQPTIGPTGLLVLGVERGGGFNPADARTLLIDITAAGRPVVEIAGGLYRPFWGPDGTLAAIESDPILIDPRTGTATVIDRPDRVEIASAWLADGSGWAATRSDDETLTPGRLTADGRFTPGTVETYQVSGLERFAGSAGGLLSVTTSDGATASETAIVEFRPDLPSACDCQVWARVVEPGGGPFFSNAVWDRDGTGLWLVFAGGSETWLSHLREPLVDAKVADLPPDQPWRIRGISTDDRWIVVGGDEDGQGVLALVDTSADLSRVLARPDATGATPMFAGWAR